ncbi:MAG TPA: hypothetical protein VJ934_05655 [Desulfomicrobiaceae bacterium]|nr:hypothetical protein [Desulfomicrobiaceae bacterium]
MPTSHRPSLFEDRLRTSIARYSEILKTMRRIALAVERSDPSLEREVRLLHDLQEQARKDDLGLLDELQEGPPSLLSHPLVAERTELLRQVLELNAALVPKIKGAMTILADELGNFKNGRVFMGGYKQGRRKHGRIVSCSA